MDRNHPAGSAGGSPAKHNPLSPQPIHNRGYIPHIEGVQHQLITYRLNDALPKEALPRLRHFSLKRQRQCIEHILDKGYGHCWLSRSDVAPLIIENWQHFACERYHLIAYVIMPNHVHVLIELIDGTSVSRIVHSWKSYTAKKILAVLRRAGYDPELPIWQPEYWDRYIRNQAHFDAAVGYVHANPAKAKLVKSPEEWRWSSCFSAGNLSDSG